MEPRRILIADDDVDALKLVGMMLERQGYEILAAANGPQTLQKAVETQPALIILDVMMPDMDGYEVAARLRSHPATESIPILMFTAKAAVNDRIAGFQAGVDDYLTKPVRPRELTSRVEALLESQTHTRDKQGRGTVIGFLPTKGGLGTSTLTLNAAIELARMRKDATSVVVELQDGAGTLAMQLGSDIPQNASFGLPALLHAPLPHLRKEVLREHMVRHESGLSALLTTSKPAGTGPEMDKGHVRTILRYLSAEYDYLLLDLPACLDESRQEALGLCDLIIVTLEPSRIGLTLARRMIETLEELNIGTEKIRLVVIHRVPVSGAASRSMIEQEVHCEMVAAIPPVPDLAYASVENGKPMVDMQPHGLTAQQVRRVVQAIIEN